MNQEPSDPQAPQAVSLDHPWFRRVMVVAAVAAAVSSGGVGLIRWLDEPDRRGTASTTTLPSSTLLTTTTTAPTTTAPEVIPDTPIDIGALPPTRSAPPSQAVAVTSDGRLVVIDTATGAERRELAHRDDPRVPHDEGGPSVIDGVTVSPDGVTVWFSTCCEPASGAVFRVPVDGSAPEEHVFDAYDPTMSASSRYVAGVSIPGVIVHDPVGDSGRVWWDDRRSGDYQEVAWSLDGAHIAVRVGLEGELLLLDTRHFAFTEAEPSFTSPLEPRTVDGTGWLQPLFSRDGTLVAAHGADGTGWTRRTIDWTSGATTSEVPLPSKPLSQTYDATGEWLVTTLEDPGDAGGHVRWEGPGGKTGTIPGTFRLVAW